MSNEPDPPYELALGQVVAWVSNGTSAHLKAVTREGDPVELGEDELRELIEVLQDLLRRMQ